MIRCRDMAIRNFPKCEVGRSSVLNNTQTQMGEMLAEFYDQLPANVSDGSTSLQPHTPTHTHACNLSSRPFVSVASERNQHYGGRGEARRTEARRAEPGCGSWGGGSPLPTSYRVWGAL